MADLADDSCSADWATARHGTKRGTAIASRDGGSGDEGARDTENWPGSAGVGSSSTNLMAPRAKTAAAAEAGRVPLADATAGGGRLAGDEAAEAVPAASASTACIPAAPAASGGVTVATGTHGARSWLAAQRARRATAAAACPRETLRRAVRGILNRLTLEKFNRLFQQLLGVGIADLEDAAIVVSEVFEKATTQHHFIDMYADLCTRISRWLAEAKLRPAAETAATGGGNGGSTASAVSPPASFRAVLVDQCQKSFAANIEAKETRGGSEGDAEPSGDQASEAGAEESRMLHKKKMIGNVMFVAALLNCGLVADAVTLSCCEQLLRARCYADATETLCAFLHKAAPRLEHGGVLDDVFEQLRRRQRAPELPARVRFLIQDLFDRRRLAWSNETGAGRHALRGPQLLSEVRREWAAGGRVDKSAQRPSAAAAAEATAAGIRAAVQAAPRQRPRNIPVRVFV